MSALAKAEKAKWFLLGMVTTFIIIVLPIVLWLTFQFISVTQSNVDQETASTIRRELTNFFNELQVESEVIIEE